MAFALMANVAAASAAALYVDDSGTDTGPNDCTVSSNPCASIEQAHDQPGTGNVIHLGGGTYTDPVYLDAGESLIEDSAFIPAAAGQAVLDVTPDPGVPALQMETTGTVSGLTINSTRNAVFITASGTLSNNLFAFGNVPDGQYNADVVIGGFTAISPTVTGNTFIDPNPEAVTPGQVALVINPQGGSPTVSDNSFTGFTQGIAALSGTATTPTISGNTITGTHDTTATGTAIAVSGLMQPTLLANDIRSPGAGSPDGTFISSAGATLRRNRVIGHRVGLRVSTTAAPVTLSSDLIARSTSGGVVLTGSTVNATNVTIVDTVSASDVTVGSGAHLNLDSSIVGAGAAPVGIDGQSSGECVITFSRGTGVDSGIGSGCATGFVSTASPMFANPAAGDYHLLAGSPMIDAGNTADPAGLFDIDGDARGLAVAPQCTVPPAGRRDIGADEFIAVCPPPPGPSTPATPAPKKCKKGQKLKKGKCVKKKRKKKKKKKKRR